jgi:membrane-associated phospholipid phosphatase
MQDLWEEMQNNSYRMSKITHLILVIIIISIGFDVQAQASNSDSITSKLIIKKSILPVALIGAGLIITNSTFEKELQTDIRNKVGNDFVFHIDDYIQYVPIAELYIADALKIKSKNHWFDQTKYLIISNIITSGITHGVKILTDKTRPNGGEHSFPSGHTSFSFTNATVLFNEFHQTSPLLAYSGYLFSTTTGAFRIINNKHWLSDVLVGAGIGILVTDIIYYIQPFKKFNPFKKSKNISIIPQMYNDGYGLYFSYRL